DVYKRQYLAWTLMACEVLYVPATTGDMPEFLTKVNAKGTPSAALTMVSLYVQGLLILLLFVSNALDFILDLTAALAVIPYLLAAGYALKLTIRRETYGPEDRSLRTDKVVAVLALVYTAFLVYAAGPKHLLLSCLLYAPATLLYARARGERGLRIFAPAELALFGIIVTGALVAVEMLAAGTIRL
ncbi:MAG: amino acid permease, partial [Mycobacterium sp.]|nr:amino acid permease [Mycobacterium sp.]